MNELFLFGLNIVGCAVLCPIGEAASHIQDILKTQRENSTKERKIKEEDSVNSLCF